MMLRWAEASLEGVPTTHLSLQLLDLGASLPPTDMAELWENTKIALEELLATKASMNTCRWRAIWELGIELHWNESKTTESIEEDSTVCSHVTLDAKALCFATIIEAKTT